MPQKDLPKFDVFLSHNRAQKDWTRQLARRLRDDGFEVWFDEWELPKHAGKDWIAGLAIGVEESRKVVLVWSPEFFIADWPVLESRVIQLIDPTGRRDRVIPIIHTACKIPQEWGFRQALNFASSHLGQLEYDFCYQQLAYNLDNSRPFEGDFERFRQQCAKQQPDSIPPVQPLPEGSRMPHASNPMFVGRERELRELARTLTPGSGATVGVHAAVTGLGGVGKSQLAIEYAHRYGRFYPGGAFWLDMESPENAMNEVALCGGPEGMDLPGFDNLKLPEQATKVQQMWEDGAAPLLVFDNASNPQVVDTWRPKTGRCSVLITSRRDDWPPELGVRPLPVQTLPREKSLELLGKARPQISTDQGQRKVGGEICDQLGDLPLALTVAAAYLRKFARDTLQEYLEALQKQPAIQNESLKEVWACFKVSFDKLGARKTTDSLAIRLFHLASHFAPASIARELLAHSAGLSYQELSDRHRTDDALARLRDLGLIAEEAEDRIFLHRLLREFARLHPPTGTKPVVTGENVAEAILKFAQQENESGLPRRLALEVAHLREAAVAAESRGSRLAGALYNELGRHARMVAAYSEAKACYERALKINEAAYGPNHPEVATAVNNLGGVLQALGDLPGAKACYERALKIDEATYGPDHPEVATDVNNLGIVLQDQGDLAGAKTCFERALKSDEAAYGPNHTKVATDVNNLGSVLHDLGDLAGAKACYERALKIDEAAYGPDHPKVAIRVNNLGGVLQDLGDLPGAKACYERALKIDEAAYGPDHPEVAIRVNNLGSVLQDLGDLAGAKACYERALKIAEAAYGPNHPAVAAAVNNLGGVLQALGDLPGAKACIERALKIDEATYGPDHPDVATDVNNLGSLLRDLGDLAGAKACFERALGSFSKFLGEDHPKTQLVRKNLEFLAK